MRDIDFDNMGNAWIATAGGVSSIKTKKMTLAKKRNIIERLLKRDILENLTLLKNADFSPGRYK